ncbi:ferritin-like domain-containing protein [Aestuariivirga litoralis]|uniref:YciE/YciF ferroxidase family protein n=1 Tax=Aestuariivirga litoralis TaxID=2650924 RepID=UPI0018C5746E|nr:ferritin-like domain-containing protein [Aestuariivirga litoralis]MBG1232413.1 ferritin-like domain-containing protein [Aestuariivirga litoralis]
MSLQTKSVQKPTALSDLGLSDLFVHGLKDIYYAEKKIEKSLPKLIKAAQSHNLTEALTDHLAETTEHVAKLEKIFAVLDMKPMATKCAAIEGILEEAQSIMDQFGKTRAGDAAIIFAAQAVEHYEITRYGSLHAFAHVLGFEQVAEIICSILKQEKSADEKLTQLAEARIDFAAATVEAVVSEAHREVTH